MNSFTPNYNLDLYDLDDKPNLNDQYNDAMNKIDTQLKNQANDLVTAETAVNNLSTKVDTFDTRITENSANIETNTTNIQTNTNNIQTNTNNIQTNTNNITHLQTSVETAQTTAERGVQRANEAFVLAEEANTNAKNAQKTLVTLGDSWVDRANGNFTPILAQMLNKKLENRAKSGAGFTTSNSIITQISTIEADPDTVDMVIVLGGVNDVKAGATSIQTAGMQLCNTLKTKFPNAMIYVFGSQNVPAVNASLTRTASSSLAYGVQQAGCIYTSMLGWFIGYTNIWDTTTQLHLTNEASTTILVSKILGVINGDNSAPLRTFTPTFNSIEGISITNYNFSCDDRIALIDLDLTLTKSQGQQQVLCNTPYGGRETYGIVTAKSSASNTTYCYVGSSGGLVLGEIGLGSNTSLNFHLSLNIPFF